MKTLSCLLLAVCGYLFVTAERKPLTQADFTKCDCGCKECKCSPRCLCVSNK